MGILGVNLWLGRHSNAILDKKCQTCKWSISPAVLVSQLFAQWLLNLFIFLDLPEFSHLFDWDISWIWAIKFQWICLPTLIRLLHTQNVVVGHHKKHILLDFIRGFLDSIKRLFDFIPLEKKKSKPLWNLINSCLNA